MNCILLLPCFNLLIASQHPTTHRHTRTHPCTQRHTPTHTDTNKPRHASIHPHTLTYKHTHPPTQTHTQTPTHALFRPLLSLLVHPPPASSPPLVLHAKWDVHTGGTSEKMPHIQCQKSDLLKNTSYSTGAIECPVHTTKCHPAALQYMEIVS